MGFKEHISKPVVSYDFDGVLHSSMIPGTIHPENYCNWNEWKPRLDIFKQLKEDAKHAKIVVVSRRDDDMQGVMWKFIHKYNLPVDKIYTVNGGSKRHTLIALRAIKHYDDDPELSQELRGTGIEFIKVKN